MKVLVTSTADIKFEVNGLECESLPVLEFEEVPGDSPWAKDLPEDLGWIVFTSPRGIRFFTGLMERERGVVPFQTQIACIGEKTMEAASEAGFEVDFYPTEMGSEGFLEEFGGLVGNNATKPRIILICAEEGRDLIGKGLREMGCIVEEKVLYRTLTRRDLANHLSSRKLGEFGAIVFTSPSSVEAVLSVAAIPEGMTVVSLGKFTSSYLGKRGFLNHKILPEGDIHRIREVL